MKVNQISTILNDVYAEVLGAENMIQDDLSNIVSAGQIITSSTFGDNFDNYAGKIIDKVGRSIFVDRAYRASDLGIWRDSWEYASMLEKVRCEVGSYTNNDEWTLLDGTDAGTDPDYNSTDIVDKLFKFVAPEVQAKYFNLKTTFRNKISITRKQLRSAFNGASEMGRFIAMIENRIRTKQEIGKQELERRVVTNLACAAYASGGANVVDLKAVLGSDKTFAQALKDQDLLRGIGETITMTRNLLKEPSKLYSVTKAFMNFTPEDLQRLIILDDVDVALRFNLYGDTFNEEFVKLDGYKTVPYWQGRKDSSGTDTLANRAKVNALALVNGDDGAVSKKEIVSIGSLVGVLFDRDAAMICNEEPEVRSQYNADGNFTNFFYNYDCSYYNDFDENVIVFVWGGTSDGTPTNITATLKAGADATHTIVDTLNTALATGQKVYAKSGDAAQNIDAGDSFTSASGWTAVTLGTTAVATAAAKIVTVIITDGTAGSGTKVLAVTSATAVVGS